MRKGQKHTKKTKTKISKARGHKGHPHTAEAKRKISESRLGEKHPNWKGGKYLKEGYVWILTSKPNGLNGRGGYKKYWLEHRVVMEKHLGRLLKKYEQVHHKNGIKHDNRISNLELVTNKTHFGKVCCPHCNKIFKIK